MNNLDKDLDIILSVFYDEGLLLMKTITSTTLILFPKSRFSLNYSDKQILLFLDLLTTDGYLIKFKPYEDSSDVYRITSKGITKYLSGGFYKERLIINKRQKLVDLAQIGVIIAGIFYIFEILKQVTTFLIWVKNIICSCG